MWNAPSNVTCSNMHGGGGGGKRWEPFTINVDLSPAATPARHKRQEQKTKRQAWSRCGFSRAVYTLNSPSVIVRKRDLQRTCEFEGVQAEHFIVIQVGVPLSGRKTSTGGDKSKNTPVRNAVDVDDAELLEPNTAA